MLLFYDPDISGPQYTMKADESKHIARVLRLKNGDELHVVNGTGALFTCVLTDNHQKHCTIDVTKEEAGAGKLPSSIHIAVAPTKNNDRFEWFLEKSTEIGISEVTPIICDHSERKVVKPERLERILVAAMKQSLKAWLPELKEATKFKDFVTSEAVNQFTGQKFIAHCAETDRTELHQAHKAGTDTLILIGPEGDFSPAEVELAMEHGFQPITLGESRLRTETAAVVACHTVNLLNQMQ